MVKLVFIVGSLRKGSFNEQLAKKVESLLPKHVDVSYLSVDLPLMNQDLEIPVLPKIQAIRDQVMAADALWIFTPAYNHAIPGSLKNALDWLSRFWICLTCVDHRPCKINLSQLLVWLTDNLQKMSLNNSSLC